MFVPDGKFSEDKAPFGVWADDELVGLLDLLLRYPTTRPCTSGCC
jgi:hypothetical protein